MDWVRRNLHQDFSNGKWENWSVVFGVVTWMLWTARNKVVFERSPSNSGNVITHAKQNFFEIMQNQNSSSHVFFLDPRYHQVLVGWQFPEMGWLKWNVDGSVYQGGSQAGCGGILRDFAGAWIMGFARNLGSTSIICSELWGIYIALCIAKDKGA